MVGAENRQQNLYLGLDLVPSLAECSGENTTPWAAFVVAGRRWGRGSGTGTAGQQVPGGSGLPGLLCLLLHPSHCPEPLPDWVSAPGDLKDTWWQQNKQGDTEPA